MSLRKFPKKRDPKLKEARVYSKNVEAANTDYDADCPELVKICELLSLGETLSAAGWKVHVCPFEALPTLHVRATKKTRGLRQ